MKFLGRSEKKKREAREKEKRVIVERIDSGGGDFRKKKVGEGKNM